MKKNNRAGSRLFFIEFLIVLFFFLIVSTVCLKIFVHAHQRTQHAESLSRSQALTSSIAEVLEARIEEGFSDTESDFAEALYAALQIFWPEGTVSSEGFILNCDGNVEPCDAKDAVYRCSVRIDTDLSNPENRQLYTHDLHVTISVTDQKDALIYELSVFFHIPLTYKEVLS